MLDTFSGPIRLAELEREVADAPDPWSQEQRLRSERIRLAITIIRWGRRRQLDDEEIRVELARHGLTWNDCDF